MKENKHNNFTEYEKAINFLKNGCNCGCSNKIPEEKFAEMREAFQALSKLEQDIFLMAQLKVMDGGIISNLKRKLDLIKELFIIGIIIHYFVRKHILIC